MAYRDSVDVTPDSEAYQADDARPSAASANPALLGFTPLEDRVIALAREDGLGSIEAPGFFERVAAMLFGLRVRARALADPRLETLRKAVVVARHRHHLPDAQAAALQGIGFTLRQIRAIEARAVAA